VPGRRETPRVRASSKQQADRIGRFDAEFFSEQPLASVELATSLRPIALGKVELDKSLMSSLAQRFEAKRRQSGLYGVSMAAGLTQSPSQALKCMQPCLAQALPLVLQPIVVPVWQ
jgi:hypothetical protein